MLEIVNVWKEKDKAKEKDKKQWQVKCIRDNKEYKMVQVMIGYYNQPWKKRKTMIMIATINKKWH